MKDLEFNNVSKRYLVREEKDPATDSHGLLSKLKRLRSRHKEFWAVRDVSFQVERGEALGIIGHNGAGKSTMLKLISGITAPTSGEIKINGRLAALIEVGSGFHPELTGRENIFLSGTILGMSRREIARKLDSIIDFAGVRQFIDMPVKRYSSGMYVRLGFAIAAHLDPDILLLDEVLAVGDAAFQAKCFERITKLRQEDKTIVFISHDLAAVEKLCTRAILMNRGQIAAQGTPSEVIQTYHDMTRREAERALETTTSDAAASEAIISEQAAEILSLEICTTDGERLHKVTFNQELYVRINMITLRRMSTPAVMLIITDADGRIIMVFNNFLDNFKFELRPGACTLEGWLPPARLVPGRYQVHVQIWDGEQRYLEAGLKPKAILAWKRFPDLHVEGVHLTGDDGMVQVPARRWVLTQGGQVLESSEIMPEDIFQAFGQQVDTNDFDMVLTTHEK